VAVDDMAGKTVVITGANSGIGKETAVALARAGARTVITARHGGRGQEAVADIGTRSGSDAVELVVFDLSDLGSVRSGATAILELCPSIDVLVNNAGLVLSDRRQTVDGFESTFAINHLGPFLLTQLLFNRITASAQGRIVNVSSTAHNSARQGLDFDDLQSATGYSAMRVYGKSKLANIYSTTELARRLEGTPATANCLHPGVVASGFGRDSDTKGIVAFGLKVIEPFVLSAEKGARTSVYLASSPEVAGVSGKYFIKCKQHRTSKAAHDENAAQRLWEASEKLIAEAGVNTPT
jgi:NAD(P)-dependent dehydrogenase (short-subunit alcohol dehydrogenase family)